MAALPALVLAALAVTSGCPAICTTADVPEAPSISAPSLRPELPSSPLPEAQVVGEKAPEALEPLALLDELTSTQLPDEGQPLPPPRISSAAPPLADSSLEDDPAEADVDREPATAADTHAPRTETAGPQAEGESAHAAPSSPAVDGEPVDQAPARLAASLLLGLAAIGLYHKLSKDRALEHATRQRILAMLEEQPGLGTTDVAEELDVCYRTARHHLEVLARFDLVVRSKRRGCWRWARPEDAEAVREPEVPELQQRMIELLREDPGLHLSAIARRLDVAKATVKHHLDRLDERGRVRDERVGPLRRFFPDGR